MTYDTSRARFIRGDFSTRDSFHRPPWAVAEARFTDLCDRCQHCINACPQQIITPGPGGYPVVSFDLRGCDFCAECEKACKPAALQRDPANDGTPWQLKAHILKNCLSLNGVVCRSCGETCEQQAINFQLKTGGIADPHIDLELCTGCGECRAVCPVKSIEIKSESTRDRAA